MCVIYFFNILAELGIGHPTMHFEFLDEDVWYKFNYEVAKQRGWALPKKTVSRQKMHMSA